MIETAAAFWVPFSLVLALGCAGFFADRIESDNGWVDPLIGVSAAVMWIAVMLASFVVLPWMLS